MSNLQLDIADIATNEKKLLKGFKVLGVFPFYLRFITTGTHIQLCKIREQIRATHPDEIKLDDFYDSKLLEKVIPLINQYCVKALVNGRFLGVLFNILLKYKVKRCSHYHILNLYLTITKLNEPAFFLSYWKLILMKTNTLSKEVTQS